MVNVSLNAFGLYAYDSILMIAHSINAFLNQGGKISFAEQSMPIKCGGSNQN
jgi:ionotropic glutamate receptor